MRSNSGVGLLSPGISASAFWLPAVLKVQETPLLDLLEMDLMFMHFVASCNEFIPAGRKVTAFCPNAGCEN